MEIDPIRGIIGRSCADKMLSGEIGNGSQMTANCLHLSTDSMMLRHIWSGSARPTMISEKQRTRRVDLSREDGGGCCPPDPNEDPAVTNRDSFLLARRNLDIFDAWGMNPSYHCYCYCCCAYWCRYCFCCCSCPCSCSCYGSCCYSRTLLLTTNPLLQLKVPP